MNKKLSYSKKDYLLYVRNLDPTKGRPLPFKDWRMYQPFFDKALGVTVQILSGGKVKGRR